MNLWDWCPACAAQPPRHEDCDPVGYWCGCPVEVEHDAEQQPEEAR